MAVRHYIECDAGSCGERVEFSMMDRDPLSEQLPPGWYIVQPSDHGVEGMQFCSLECLQRHGYDAVKARGAKLTTMTLTPCDECGMLIGHKPGCSKVPPGLAVR